MSTVSANSPLPTFIEFRFYQLSIEPSNLHLFFATKKRYTRQCNAPERITLETLLRLSFRIKVHPLSLVDEYRVASLMITTEDKAQLRAHYVIDSKPIPLRDETLHDYFPSPSVNP